MTMTNPEVSTRPQIRIYSGPSAATYWTWFVNDPRIVVHYSGRIVLSSENFDCGFSQLLQIAIVCWNYECDMHNFRDFAEQVQKKYQLDEPRRGPSTIVPRQRSTDWMFIALVFEWAKVFQEMSVKVVMEYDPRRDRMNLEAYRDLPEDFRELISKVRREMVLKTYNHVRNSWIMLYHPEQLFEDIMTKILAHFNEWHLRLDLRKPEPGALDEINPGKLLLEFEEVLERTGDRQVELQPRPSETMGVSSLQKQGRSGSFSTVARQTVKAGAGSMKRMVKGNRTATNLSCESSETSESWEQRRSSLTFETNDWRSRNLLPGIPINHEFLELRSQHIRTYAAVELSTNGTRP